MFTIIKEFTIMGCCLSRRSKSWDRPSTFADKIPPRSNIPKFRHIRPHFPVKLFVRLGMVENGPRTVDLRPIQLGDRSAIAAQQEGKDDLYLDNLCHETMLSRLICDVREANRVYLGKSKKSSPDCHRDNVNPDSSYLDFLVKFAAVDLGCIVKEELRPITELRPKKIHYYRRNDAVTSTIEALRWEEIRASYVRLGDFEFRENPDDRGTICLYQRDSLKIIEGSKLYFAVDLSDAFELEKLNAWDKVFQENVEIRRDSATDAGCSSLNKPLTSKPYPFDGLCYCVLDKRAPISRRLPGAPCHGIYVLPGFARIDAVAGETCIVPERYFFDHNAVHYFLTTILSNIEDFPNFRQTVSNPEFWRTHDLSTLASAASSRRVLYF